MNKVKQIQIHPLPSYSTETSKGTTVMRSVIEQIVIDSGQVRGGARQGMRVSVCTGCMAWMYFWKSQWACMSCTQ